MTLCPNSPQIKADREAVLKAVQENTPPKGGNVACTLRDVCRVTRLDDRVVDRALQFWRKEGKLIFRTKKQAKKGKPAGWSAT